MVGVVGVPLSGGESESDQLQKNGEQVELGLLPNNFEPGQSINDGKNLGVNGDNVQTDACTADGGNSEVKQGYVGTEVAAATAGYKGVIVGEGISSNVYPQNGDNLVLDEGEVGVEEGQIVGESTEVDMDLVYSPIRQAVVEVVNAVAINREVNTEEGSQTQNESLTSKQSVFGGCVSGFKRSRMTYNEQQPSVRIAYNSLTRASKRKLEELLQQWSEWHVQYDSPSQELNEVLESGENTYFPALCIGVEKPSAVSFWIDSQTAEQQSIGISSLDSNSVPLYDRGYALGLTSEDGRRNVEGGLEIMDDAARCFNCGSYNHSLKECPKPRDNLAVNSARKQHKLKKVQTSGSQNASRYYQSSTGAKYDGLKPGALDPETRKLLGLGELDPPPWLNRMRELGYPLGYLDLDEKAQPSGIAIIADGNTNEDGEITETVFPEPRRKMSVEFPGINAPIPENAKEKLWASGPSGSDALKGQSVRRSNYFSESCSRSRHHEERWSRDSKDDGPPGVDLVVSPPHFDSVVSPHASSYPPRYGNYDLGYRYDGARDLTPFSRSHPDRGRRSTFAYDDFISHSPYDSSPYSSSANRYSPPEYALARNAYRRDEVRDDYGLDYTFRSSYEYDRYRRHGRQ